MLRLEYFTTITTTTTKKTRFRRENFKMSFSCGSSSILVDIISKSEKIKFELKKDYLTVNL